MFVLYKEMLLRFTDYDGKLTVTLTVMQHFEDVTRPTGIQGKK